MPTDHATAMDKGIDLCSLAKDKLNIQDVSGIRVRFVDQVKEFSNWWNESTGGQTDTFGVTCSGEVTVGLASTGLAGSHQVDAVGIALVNSNDIENNFSSGYLKHIIAEYQGKRTEAITNILVTTIFAVISLVTMVETAATLPVAIVIYCAIDAVYDVAATGLIAGQIVALLVEVAGFITSMYFMADAVKKGREISELSDAQAYISRNMQFDEFDYDKYIHNLKDSDVCQLENYCDAEKSMMQISNFTYIHETYSRYTPIIHYKNVGENEKTIMFPEVSSFQHSLSNIIRVDQTEIKDGAEIWLNSVEKNTNNEKTSSDHYIYNRESTYRAGYVSQGTHEHPDNHLYLVAFSNDPMRFFNEIKNFATANKGSLYDSLSIGNSSGVYDDRELTDFDKLYFMLNITSLIQYESTPSDEFVRIALSYLQKSNNRGIKAFLTAERNNIQYQAIHRDNNEDDSAFSAKLVENNTQTKTALYKIMYISAKDGKTNLALSALNTLYKVLHYADNTSQFFSDSSTGEESETDSNFISLSCPDLLYINSQDDQTVLCNVYRNDYAKDKAATYYLHTEDSDIVSLGGMDGSCEEFTTGRSTTGVTPIGFSAGATQATLNVCVRKNSILSTGAVVGFTDSSTGKNFEYAGKIRILPNNLNDISCSKPTTYKETIHCTAKRSAKGDAHEFQLKILPEKEGQRSGMNLLSDVKTISFRDGNDATTFDISRSDWSSSSPGASDLTDGNIIPVSLNTSTEFKYERFGNEHTLTSAWNSLFLLTP